MRILLVCVGLLPPGLLLCGPVAPRPELPPPVIPAASLEDSAGGQIIVSAGYVPKRQTLISQPTKGRWIAPSGVG